MVTSAVGWVFSTTVKVAVPPASVVTRPEVGVTVMPGGVVVGVGDRHVGGVQAVVGGVGAGGGRGDDRVGDVAVVDASSTPVTVTVCGAFQLAGGEGQAGRRDRAFGRVAELTARW